MLSSGYAIAVFVGFARFLTVPCGQRFPHGFAKFAGRQTAAASGENNALA